MEKLPRQSGIQLRQEVFEPLLNGPRKAHWLAFAPEEFLAMGGGSHHILEQLADTFPLSMIARGLSIGSAESVNETHVQNIHSLVDRYNPCNISTPLSWCRWQGKYFAEDLPLPLSYETLDQVSINLRAIQNTLGRRVLVSNAAQYIHLKTEELPLGEFYEELVRLSGCGIALNLTALYVNALNRDRDPFKDLKELPLAAVREIHLCGQTQMQLNADRVLVMEDAEESVSKPVWQLFRELLNLLPKPVATLIRWRSNSSPNLKQLFDDTRKVDELIDARINEKDGSEGLAL